jgi:hypothetical protein
MSGMTQLRLDLGQLATSITERRWTRSEDHIVTLGMKYRSTWRDQHATISRKLMQIDGLAKLHNLTDLRDRIMDTRLEVKALSTRIELIIHEIEATHRTIMAHPIKLPSYSGDVSKDITTFKNHFNKTPGGEQLGEMRDRLTGKAVANLSPNGLKDIREAWLLPQEALDNSHNNLHYTLSRIGRTPGLTDKLMETDPGYAATWFFDYGNAVKEVLNLGNQGPKPEALAFSARALYTIASRLPPNIISNIRGTKRHGRPMLRTISAAISKARMEALARSMMPTDNINAKKATPREFYPDGISRTHLNRRRCKHPETTGICRAQVSKYRGMCLQCLTPALGHWHDMSPRSPNYHPPERGHPPAPSIHRADDTPTDNGRERPVMPPLLEDPGTVNVVNAAAGLMSGRLDYWDTHGHLPLAKRNTGLGEDSPAGFN